MSGRLNVHLYQSPFRHESRILRMTAALVRERVFDAVRVFAVADGVSPGREQVDGDRAVRRLERRLRRGGLGFVGKVLGTMEWMVRVVMELRGHPVVCVNSHSLSVLPLGVLVKRLKRCRLVYEPHELETETVGLTGVRRRLAKWVERAFIGRAELVIVVNDSIAAWYREAYGLDNVVTVRNMPACANGIGPDASPLRGDLGLSADELLFIYQGLLSKNRGIETLVEAFGQLPEAHIVFMGYGVLTDFIVRAAQKHSNIHYHPAVVSEDVVKYASGADVGLFIIDNLCLSYYLSLPNKVFEYVQAGLPMILPDFPEFRHLVGETGCGWNVGSTVAEIEGLVRSLARTEIETKRRAAIATRKFFRWETEEHRLLAAYASAGATSW